MRIINMLALLAALPMASTWTAARAQNPVEPEALTIVLPSESDWKTPVFGRGIDQLMKLTPVNYRVIAAPFARGDALMAQTNTCSGFSSQEYAQLTTSIWIGPLIILRIVIFAAPSAPEAKSLNDLSGRPIGVMSNSYLSRWADRHGLKIAPVAIDNLNFGKLELGRIDYWLTYRQTAEAFARHTQQELPKQVLTLDQLPIGLACNANMDRSIIASLQAAAKTYFITRGEAGLDLD